MVFRYSQGQDKSIHFDPASLQDLDSSSHLLILHPFPLTAWGRGHFQLPPAARFCHTTGPLHVRLCPEMFSPLGCPWLIHLVALSFVFFLPVQVLLDLSYQNKSSLCNSHGIISQLTFHVYLVAICPTSVAVLDSKL